MILTIMYLLLTWIIGDFLPIDISDTLTLIGLDIIIFKLRFANLGDHE